MKPEQERLKALLVDTITLLSKNGLNFIHNLKVQGLLAITTDNDSVFVVQINETFEPEVEENSTVSTETLTVETELKIDSVRSAHSQSDAFSSSRKRLRPSQTFLSASSEFSNVTSLDASDIPSTRRTMSSSRNIRAKTGSGSATNVSVKLENQNLDIDGDETGNVMLIETDNESDVEEIKDEEKNTNSKSFTTPKPSPGRAHVKSTFSKRRYNSFSRNDNNGMRTNENENVRTVKNELSYSISSTSAPSFNEDAEGGDWNFQVDNLGAEQEDVKFSNNSVEQTQWDTTEFDENEGEDYYQNNSSMAHASWDLDDESSEGRKAGGLVCQYEGCSKSFNYQRNLDRHQRVTHGAKYGMTGQMCFFCTIPRCGRIFYKNCNLHKHQREAHGLDVLI